MTTPSSPPASSLKYALARAALISRLIASFLVTIVCVRFAVASFQHATGTSGPSLPAVSAAPASDAAHTPPVRPRAASSQSAAPPPSGGPPRSIQLGISAGPGRSEIYVNGRLVGNTPFVGDTSCKTGMPLKIELVPPSGPPMVYERACRGAIIEISGPPP